ncbi:MAG: hypothetical protein AAF512_19320 [Pseudomonadota bacterium]
MSCIPTPPAEKIGGQGETLVVLDMDKTNRNNWMLSEFARHLVRHNPRHLNFAYKKLKSFLEEPTIDEMMSKILPPETAKVESSALKFLYKAISEKTETRQQFKHSLNVLAAAMLKASSEENYLSICDIVTEKAFQQSQKKIERLFYPTMPGLLAYLRETLDATLVFVSGSPTELNEKWLRKISFGYLLDSKKAYVIGSDYGEYVDGKRVFTGDASEIVATYEQKQIACQKYIHEDADVRFVLGDGLSDLALIELLKQGAAFILPTNKKEAEQLREQLEQREALIIDGAHQLNEYKGPEPQIVFLDDRETHQDIQRTMARLAR